VGLWAAVSVRYMVGALQLRALYKDLVGGGKMTRKEFNDGVLGATRCRLKMVRAELGEQRWRR